MARIRDHFGTVTLRPKSTDRGYRVIEAGSGDEAVAAMNDERRVDVVFTDVRMPGGLDGFALAQWIRRERPATQVIPTSATTTRAAHESTRMCECGPLVAKPYEPADVERRIIRALSRV